jgi:hypothetical protein
MGILERERITGSGTLGIISIKNESIYSDDEFIGTLKHDKGFYELRFTNYAIIDKLGIESVTFQDRDDAIDYLLSL